MKLINLRTNHRIAPLGIDGVPEFSWQLESDIPNTIQTAYQIIVRAAEKKVWDSGREESREQTFIPYDGETLKSCTWYIWCVTVWDNHGNCAAAEDSFETAFLRQEDWKAPSPGRRTRNTDPETNLRLCGLPRNFAYSRKCNLPGCMPPLSALTARN